jgi:hypothetical protein
MDTGPDPGLGSAAGLLDADALVGLLADDARRRVVAALVLGAHDVGSVRAATGLDARTTTRALRRLDDAGLVVAGADGTVVLVAAAFTQAARAAAARRPAPVEEHGDAPAEQARVLRTFVQGGRLTSIPSAHGKRLVVLDWLAQRFEPGRKYSERMVNAIIGQVHADTAALRRYLVDEGFMDREAGEYWRAGGTFAPEE